MVQQTSPQKQNAAPQQVKQVKQTKSTASSGDTGHRNYISEALAKEVLTKLTVDPMPHVRVVQATLETFVNLLVDKTIHGESTTITNFATFSRRYVKDRMHKNPQTNEPAPKAAHYKMHVEVKPALKDKLETIAISAEDKKNANAK